ncbi:MAG: DUF2341 domain-containing protein [Verrucomicrobiota bacterium]
MIISRNTSSGSYVNNATEIERWNCISTPMINLSAYLTRNSRWRWLNSERTVVTGSLEAQQPGHAIFAGVGLNSSNQVTIRESLLDIVLATDAGNGVNLGTDSANGRVWVAYWDAGVEFYIGSGEYAGGPRMFLGAGGFADPFAGGAENVNADGERLFLNAVDYMLGRPRLKVAFTAYDKLETLTNIPLLVSLSTNLPNFDYADFVSPEGHDLRVWNSNRTALLNYEIETWDTNGVSHVWVQVPELHATETCIQLSWGNVAHTNQPAYTTNGAVWSEEFVAVHHLRETAGLSAPDSTSNNLAGTLQNMAGTEWAAGAVGNGLRFDGTDDSYTLTNISSFFGDAATFSAWVKLDVATPLSVNQTGFADLGGAGPSHYPDTDGMADMAIFRASNRVENIALSPSVDRTAWHRVTMTSDDGGPGIWRMYQNGVQIYIEPPAAIALPATPRIGGQGTNVLDGMFDEVRLSSVERSSNWVWATWLNAASNDQFNTALPVTNGLRPTLTNAPATNITAGTAWFNAFLVDDITEHDVIVFWGPVDGGTNPVAWANSASFGSVDSSSPSSISYQALSGIVPGATNWFTFALTNCAGLAWATPSMSYTSSFTAVPEIDFGSTNILFTGGADLSWNLLQGEPANVTIYYGDNNGGTNPASWDNALDVGLQAFGEDSALITGLFYGVAYDYTLFASNAVGTDWAPSSGTFKVLSPDFGFSRSWRTRTFDTIQGAAQLDPIATLLGQTPTAIHSYTNAVFDYNDFAGFQPDYPSLTDGNNFSLLWESSFYVDAGSTGAYTFGTASDDGSVWYIDLNRDGDFADAGELVVDNNGNHGRTVVTGGVTIDEPGCYPTVVAFYENGGGENMEAKWGFGSGIAYGSLSFVDGSAASTDPFYSDCPTGAIELVNLPARDIITGEADFNARITARQSLFYLDVFYGTNDGGTNATSWSNVISVGTVSDISQTEISQTVSNLLPSVTYYYAWRMTNCLEELWGTPSQSLLSEAFVNNKPGPIVGTGSATISGTLGAGAPADVTLYWGDNDGGTSAGAWDHAIVFSNPSLGEVSATLTGLLFGVQYYYRTYMTNAGGEAWANSTTNFKTRNPLNQTASAAWLYSNQRSDGGNILNPNGTEISLDWNVHQIDNARFDHNGALPDQLTVLQAGDYFVAFTLPLTNNNTSVNNRRTSVRAQLYVNGVSQATLGAVGESSFIRAYENAGNRHSHSSDHFATLVTNIPAGATLELRVVSTASNTSDLEMQQASLYVESVDASRTVFAAATTDGGQDMTPVTERTVAWEETVRNDTGFTLQAGNSNILLQAAGAYLVYVNLPYTGTGQRESAKLQIKLDGIRIPGGQAKQGYIRAQNGHNDASVHFSGMVIATNANQMLSVTAIRETTLNTATPVANGRMSILVERVDTSAGVFFSRATEVTTDSSNWNPSSPGQEVEWENDDIIDTAVYSHSVLANPQQIVVEDEGDFMLVYNDSFTSSVQRGNPLITIRTNGVPVPGAQTKTHYARDGNHQESSGSLVFYLNDLAAGSTVSVHTVQDFEAGTMTPDDDALLVLQRKSFELPLLMVSLTNVAGTSAEVNAVLDGQGATYDFTLFWGPTDGGTNAGTWSNTVSFGTITDMVSSNTYLFTNLVAGDQVFFSWRASNCAQIVWSDSPRSFFTEIVPVVGNGSGGTPGPGTGEATLEADLIQGEPANVLIYWGNNNGGTDPMMWDSVIDLGVVSNGVSLGVASNLLFGQTYYYRSYVTNLLGETWATNTETFVSLNPAGQRAKITFCGYDRNEPLTNFPVLVELGSAVPGFTNATFLSPAGDDLRFWNTDQSSLLNHEIESWNPAGTSLVWVQVPLLTSNLCIWASWGDPAQASVPASSTNGAAWSSFLSVHHLHDANLAGDLPDSSPSGYDGVNFGSTDAPGFIGDAQDFDGVDDYIDTGVGYLSGLSAFTIHLWANTRTFENREGYVGQNDVVEYGPNANPALWNGGGVLSGGAIPASTWTHIVVTKSPDGRRFYYNGIQVASDATFNTRSSAFTVKIGGGGIWDASGNFSDGLLDEIRISSVERSSNWVWATWLNTASNDGFNCVDEVLPGFHLSNQPATMITSSSAVLNASFDGEGAIYDVWAYWGSNDGDTNQAAWSNAMFMGTFTNLATNFGLAVSGLVTGQQYFTWRAMNPLTDNWAEPSEFFSTAFSAPAFDTGSGADLAFGGARLNGTLVSGNIANVTFYWGDNDGGTDTSLWDNAVSIGDQGEGALPPTAVTNLLFGVRYYYQVFATNQIGGAWAPSTVVFKTTARAPEVVMDDLQFWLDAEDSGFTFTTDNNVDVWMDRSGNGLDASRNGAASATGIQRITNALNGKAAVRFVGANTDYMNLAGSVVMDTAAGRPGGSAFVIAKTADNVLNHSLMSRPSNQQFFRQGGNNVVLYNGTSPDPTAVADAVTDDRIRYADFNYDRVDRVRYFVNGSALTVNNNQNLDPGGWDLTTVGGIPGGGCCGRGSFWTSR